MAGEPAWAGMYSCLWSACTCHERSANRAAKGRVSGEGTHQRGVGEGARGHQRLEVGLNTACLFSGSAPPGLVLQPSLPHHTAVSRGPHPSAPQTKAPHTQSVWLGCMFVGAVQCVCGCRRRDDDPEGWTHPNPADVTAGVSCCGGGEVGRALSAPRWKMAPDLMGSRRGVRATTEPPSFKPPPLGVVMALRHRTARVLACHCCLGCACAVPYGTPGPRSVHGSPTACRGRLALTPSVASCALVCAQCVSAPVPLAAASRYDPLGVSRQEAPTSQVRPLGHIKSPPPRPLQ